MISSPLRDVWHSPVWLNRFSAVLFALSIMGFAALVAFWLANRPVFTVKRVIVDTPSGSLKHVSASQVQAAVLESLNGTVLSTDLQTMHRALASIPWVRSATVRRIWPNRLLVRLEEQHAVGTWGNQRLVNRFGELFTAQAADHDDPCRLIPLSGPAGSQRLVLERAVALSQWLAPIQKSLASLTLSDQYAWTAELGGNTVLELGRDALPTPVEERVRNFVKTQAWLAAQLGQAAPAAQLTHADLRYATGYAFRPATSGAAVNNEAAIPLCIGAQA
jgi:cell division protein FtsQ